MSQKNELTLTCSKLKYLHYPPSIVIGCHELIHQGTTSERLTSAPELTAAQQGYCLDTLTDDNISVMT